MTLSTLLCLLPVCNYAPFLSSAYSFIFLLIFKLEVKFSILLLLWKQILQDWDTKLQLICRNQIKTEQNKTHFANTSATEHTSALHMSYLSIPEADARGGFSPETVWVLTWLWRFRPATLQQCKMQADSYFSMIPLETELPKETRLGKVSVQRASRGPFSNRNREKCLWISHRSLGKMLVDNKPFLSPKGKATCDGGGAAKTKAHTLGKLKSLHQEENQVGRKSTMVSCVRIPWQYSIPPFFPLNIA